MNKLLLILSLSFTLSTIAQTSVKKELKLIETPEQVEEYLETNKSKKNKLLVFNEKKHKSKLAKELLEMPIFFTKTNKEQFKKTHYKVIRKDNVPHYRISYIYFDGDKISIDRIYELRKKIMVEYNKGIKFEDLAKRYSMDDNALKGGDSGWVKDGELPIEIENEANDLKHSLDDIFDVKTKENNGFYIIKKTHRIQEIKEVSVLKVIEAIE